MSCNTKTSLAAVIDAVNAQLNNNYVDRDDPRIDQGVFTEPTIRGGLMLDEAAKLDFCGYVTECGQREPFGKQWIDRPLYPDNMLISYDDEGEIKSKWQSIEDTIAANSDSTLREDIVSNGLVTDAMVKTVPLDGFSSSLTRNQASKNADNINASDFGGKLGILSDKFATVAEAKLAYPDIAARITTLDHSFFWCALQSAIIAVSAKGGGLIDVSAGMWNLSDPIYGANNVTVRGTGDSCVIQAEVNTRWQGRHLFYAQDANNFFIENLKIDQQGRSRAAVSYMGASLLINKAKASGARNVTFVDASDITSKSSIPQIYIIAKDVAADMADVEGAVIGGVDGATVTHCRFSMPDANNRCGFAIRMMTNFLNERPHADFINHVKNCDISHNSFDGDYFWNIIELAGGGTILNNINFNRAKGSSLTFVDFDKGCSYNTAMGNIAEDIRFPVSLVDNPSVLTSIFSDHGTDTYFNTGNKLLFNICKYAEGPGKKFSESALHVQNAILTTIHGNTVENVNNGAIGSGLHIGSSVSLFTASENRLVGVRNGISTAATWENVNAVRLLNNDIISEGGTYVISAKENALITGTRISGGSAKTLSNSSINMSVGMGSRLRDIYIGGGIIIEGGGDGISAGAEYNTIDNVSVVRVSGRGFRLINGETSISNSSVFQATLGDIIIQNPASAPTLHNNSFSREEFRSHIVSKGTAAPSTGAWNLADRIENQTPTAGGYMGWVCTSPGTMGTLVGVTATTTTGSNVITVNTTAGLYKNHLITIAGFSGRVGILGITGNQVTITRAVTVDLSGAAVAYSNATFKGYGLIES